MPATTHVLLLVLTIWLILRSIDRAKRSWKASAPWADYYITGKDLEAENLVPKSLPQVCQHLNS